MSRFCPPPARRGRGAGESLFSRAALRRGASSRSALLINRDGARHRTPETTADDDGLWVRADGELSAVPAAAVVGERAYQLARGRHVYAQHGARVAARRLHAQLSLVRVVLGALDGDGVGRRRWRLRVNRQRRRPRRAAVGRRDRRRD